MFDWNQPIEQFPEEIAFSDLPPLARELIRRNVKLRQQLQEAEAALRAENSATLKAELESARQRIQSLEEALKELGQRIEER
jgi:predicted RNase H-like nuclease (RuvC/YqgF family)